MEFIKKAGVLTGKGVATIQAKAEREDWKGKSSAAAKSCGDSLSQAYEKHTGRSYKFDTTAAKVGMVGGGAAVVAFAAPTVIMATAVAGAGVAAASTQVDKAKDHYGKERADKHIYKLKQGANSAADLASRSGRSFSEGFNQGMAEAKKSATAPDGNLLLVPLPPTTPGTTGWYFNNKTGQEEFWECVSPGTLVQAAPPAGVVPPNTLIDLTCPGCSTQLRVPNGTPSLQCPTCMGILELAPPMALPVAPVVSTAPGVQKTL